MDAKGPNPDDAPESMAGRIRLAPGVVVPEGVLRFSFTTSSGPGGQNVNKRATCAELRVQLMDIPIHPQARERLARLASHRVTEAGELIIESDVHRSQGRNRDECVQRLCDLVKQAIVKPKVRKATKPSAGSKRRRLDDKKRRGDVKRGRGSRGED